MTFTTVIAEGGRMSPDELTTLFVSVCIVSPIIIVIRLYGAGSPETGKWVAWQQAHTAVQMTIKRDIVRTVLATSLALAIHALDLRLFVFIPGIVAFDGLVGVAAARYAMARLDRPQVRIERRGNWLLVEGPRWVHCSAKAWERATALTAASAGIQRRN